MNHYGALLSMFVAGICAAMANERLKTAVWFAKNENNLDIKTDGRPWSIKDHIRSAKRDATEYLLFMASLLAMGFML